MDPLPKVRLRNGYPIVYMPSHPRATVCGIVYEHTLIAEQALGRYLPDGAEVHHIDLNKQNNANSNLVICQDTHYHRLLHVRSAIIRAGGDPITQQLCRKCGLCKTFDDFHIARKARNGRSNWCKACSHVLAQEEWRRSRERKAS